MDKKEIDKILEELEDVLAPIQTGNRRYVHETGDHPMTVKELKEALEGYDDDKYVIFNRCNAHLLGDESFRTHIINHTVSVKEKYVLLIGEVG